MCYMPVKILWFTTIVRPAYIFCMTHKHYMDITHKFPFIRFRIHPFDTFRLCRVCQEFFLGIIYPHSFAHISSISLLHHHNGRFTNTDMHSRNYRYILPPHIFRSSLQSSSDTVNAATSSARLLVVCNGPSIGSVNVIIYTVKYLYFPVNNLPVIFWPL